MRPRGYRPIVCEPTRRRGAESDLMHRPRDDRETPTAQARQVVGVEVLLRVNGRFVPLPDTVASSDPVLWHYWQAIYELVVEAVDSGSPCIVDVVPVRT
jgi:hypothetical protein